jgi:hypothetical protein
MSPGRAAPSTRARNTRVFWPPESDAACCAMSSALKPISATIGVFQASGAGRVATWISRCTAA